MYKPGRNVILNSGGMDSFFVTRELAKWDEFPCHVFVDIGQKYNVKEVHSAFRIADHFGHKVVCLMGAQIGVYETPSGIIPLRNAELLLTAAQFGDTLHMGILENEVNSDKSPEFLRAMEQVLTISCRAQYWSEGREYRIMTPLGTRSKVELVTEVWEECQGDMGHRTWIAMMKTVSCYDEGNSHCGRCPSCFKRWVALTAAVGLDMAHGVYGFKQHPATWKTLEHWESQNYDAKRIAEIRTAYGIAEPL